ncbi:hypothetical protein LOTGIDRAFT_160559 [Lottia gigantea]|uniref:Uncharacterized protein n=1 Tax=Lottia gigantea TaxID=225164 RepID=V4AL17_LOTGI|nr:hypothetical protein LOTGIDRAFT_160559 [Lottia gigantea]ESO95420.1 hypothetical protein LOTGIDRAFT_160559 [Lottia gigantea]
MHSIRQMFESGETDNNPTSPQPSTRQSLAPQSSVQIQPQQPKPVPRGKPKLADLPAKPKVYCVPVHKSQLDGVSSSPGNIHQDLKRIYESPRKLSEPAVGSLVAQSSSSVQKGDNPVRGKPVMKTASFNVSRRATQDQNEKDTSLASELQVKLRKRQTGNAIKVHPNRKSEADMTSPPVSEKPPLPLSPKRFSDSFENNPSKTSDLRVQFDLQTIPGTPRQSQDASNANDDEAEIDVSAKAKLFESKKNPPERPALPKFKPGHIRQRSAGSVVEYSKINKSKESTANQESVNTDSTPEPPKKPPRTHAHDEYLKVKLKQNKVQYDDSCQEKETSHKTEQPTSVKSPVYETIDKDDSIEEEIYGVQVIPISIKDRISQLHQRPLSCQDDTLTRKHPPARPPPPRLRPHSEFNKSPAAQSATHASLFFPKTAPEIPDTSPPLEVYEPAPAFKKYGTMPRRPRKNRPSSSGENDKGDSPSPKAKSGSKKFPMRKSLSSECLYMGNGVCERFYHDPAEFVGPAETFEAYVDNEGYAVPNKFIKRKVREKASWDPESVVGRFANHDTKELLV